MRLAPALLLAVVILVSCTPAEALSIVNAEAIFEWTGFAFTTTGSLSVTEVDHPSSYPHTSTSIQTTPTTPEGSATAATSAVDGFITMSAGAEATAPGFASVGRASVSAMNVFWFYGLGTGSLVVTVPYHLELTSIESTDRDITSARAWVYLQTGPGVGSNPDWFVTDTLSLTGAGEMTRDGVLTATRPLSDPTWGPLVSLVLVAEVSASAAVPEASPILLLGLGLLVAGALGWRWWRRTEARR